MKLFQETYFSWKQPGLQNKFVMAQKTMMQKLFFGGSLFVVAAFFSLLFVGGLAFVAKLVKGELTQPILIFLFIVICAVLSIGLIIENTRTSTIYIRETGIYSSRGFRLKFSDIRDFSLVPVIFRNERVFSIVLNCHNDEQYCIEVSNSISENELKKHLSKKLTFVPDNNEIILG